MKKEVRITPEAFDVIRKISSLTGYDYSACVMVALVAYLEKLQAEGTGK